jgi:ABC-type polysaccharide transport system permease subunit
MCETTLYFGIFCAIIYRTGLLNQRYRFTAGAGIFQSIISTVLVVSAIGR